MFIFDCTCRMVSIGQGEPAMMPVRRLEKSYWLKLGCSSWAMYMVGTPSSDVHFSLVTAFITASGSNDSPTITMQAPCVVQAMLPNTMPKQW